MILGACEDGSDAVLDGDKSTPPCADDRNTCTIKRIKEIEKLVLECLVNFLKVTDIWLKKRHIRTKIKLCNCTAAGQTNPSASARMEPYSEVRRCGIAGSEKLIQIWISFLKV